MSPLCYNTSVESARDDSRRSDQQRIKAITFDFWGTLYENGPDLTPQYVRVLAGSIPGQTADSLQAALRTAQKLALNVGQMGFRLSVEARVAVVLDELGTALPQQDRERLTLALENVLLDVAPPLVAGARDVLDSLSRRGYALGLISDTGMHPGRVAREVMARDGILGFFQHCTFSDELGVNKRWRQPFLATCLALGVAPDETLHVGDLPETDVRPARAAGLRVALATYVSKRFDGAAAADIVLSNLADLPSALAHLLGHGPTGA